MSEPNRVLVFGGAETSQRLSGELPPEAHRIWKIERTLRGRRDGGWLHWLMAMLDADQQGGPLPQSLDPWTDDDEPWDPRRIYRWRGGLCWSLARPGLTADAFAAMLRFAAGRLREFRPDLVVIAIGDGDLSRSSCLLKGVELDPDGNCPELQPRCGYRFAANHEEATLRPAVERVLRGAEQLFPAAERVLVGPLRSVAMTSGGAERVELASRVLRAAATAHGIRHLLSGVAGDMGEEPLPSGLDFAADGHPPPVLQRRLALALRAILRKRHPERFRAGPATEETDSPAPATAMVDARQVSPQTPRRRQVALPGAPSGPARLRLLVIGASEANRRRSLGAPAAVQREWAAELARRYELPGMWPLRLMRLLERQLDPRWRNSDEGAAWGIENIFQRGCSYRWKQTELWNIAAPQVSVGTASSLVGMHLQVLAEFAPHAVILCLGRTDLAEKNGKLAGIDVLETGAVANVVPWGFYEVPPQVEAVGFAQELGRIVRTLRVGLPESRLILMDLLPLAVRSRRQAERHATYNRAIGEIAAACGAQHEDYSFLPAEGKFRWEEWLHADHHPNDLFNQAIADSLAARLARLLT
jgi:hypothetical protein